MDTLKDGLPVIELKKECQHLHFRTLFFKNRWRKTTIDVIAPTQRFLELLTAHKRLLKHYFFTYLEIANDEHSKDELHAEMDFMQYVDKLRKKYSHGFIYDHQRELAKEQRIDNLKSGLFSNKTYYSKKIKKGKPPLLYVVYPRYSKINWNYSDKNSWQPCLHKEWRIRGKSTIKRLTNISHVTDFIKFNYKSFFTNMENEHMVLENLNYDALGRWLEGFDGRRTLTRRQKLNVGVSAEQFCNMGKITSYSDLINYLKKEKEKISHSKGLRTGYERKVLELKSFGRFREAL